MEPYATSAGYLSDGLIWPKNPFFEVNLGQFPDSTETKLGKASRLLIEWGLPWEERTDFSECSQTTKSGTQKVARSGLRIPLFLGQFY